MLFVFTWAEFGALCDELTGVRAMRLPLPKPVLFAAASLLDQIRRVRSLAYPLTRDAAEMMTTMVPTDDQPTLDPLVSRWGQKHAVRNLPLGVFEDTVGPPSYRLAADADVTVLLFVKQKVVANFAFRNGELNDEKVAEVMKALAKILPEKK